MARGKLTARKRALVPPPVIPRGVHWAAQPVIKAHSSGLHAGYLPNALEYMLRGLGYDDTPIYFGERTPLRHSGYAWRVRVVIFKKPEEEYVSIERATYYAPAPRATFEDGIRDAAREALARIRQEMDEELRHTQYAHLPMKAHEDARTVVRRARNGDSERLKELVKYTTAHDEVTASLQADLAALHHRNARNEDTIGELLQIIAELQDGDDNNGEDGDEEDPEDDDDEDG